eukprot:1421415-Rhodomonas_salina.1
MAASVFAPLARSASSNAPSSSPADSARNTDEGQEEEMMMGVGKEAFVAGFADALEGSLSCEALVHLMLRAQAAADS